ncbi:MAG: hypothetical protein ACRYFU_25955 [Janthinobacterium lividum]
MNEDEHHKEVYAYFGLAVYQAQVLESGLINALVTLDFMPSNVRHTTTKTDWSDKFDAFFDSRAALTMGNLVHALRKVMTVPDNLEEQLKTALEKRKFLVHHYFREKIMLFTTERGRDEIIKDLGDYADSFIAADRALDEYIQPIEARYGLTPEKHEAILKEMIEEHRRKHG